MIKIIVLSILLPFGVSAAEISIGGLVEVEMNKVENDGYVKNKSTSDITLATVEVGLESKISSSMDAVVSLLYEEGATDLEVDQAFLRKKYGPWSVQAGQSYLPFGTYETSMISDPLTLELAEAREVSVMASFSNQGFGFQAYSANGDKDRVNSLQKINLFGARLSYAMETERLGLKLNMDYMNNIADSDGMTSAVTALHKQVPAMAAGMIVQYKKIGFFAEYVTALEEFADDDFNWENNKGAKPSALNLELSYGLESVKLALGYQQSAEFLKASQPEKRMLFSLGTELDEGSSLSFEFMKASDYEKSNCVGTTCGTGEHATTLTAQWAAEF